MREHVPTLFVRASSLLRFASHLYHHFLRLIEIGFLYVRRGPQLHHSSAPGKPRSPTTTDEQISSQQDSGRPEKEKPGPPDSGLPSVLTSNESESLAQTKIIISIHIPKTGGTTFLDVLQASAQEILYQDYGVGINPTSLFRNGKRIEEPFESISDIESLPGRSVIHGHFCPAKYLHRFPHAAYVTWLRDPVERLASHYFFWQRRPFMEDPLCNRVIAEKMTLEEFARLEVTRNVQSRFLTPLGVQGFAFVGITEEYERSLELFRRLISPGVQIAPEAQNINPERSRNFYDLAPGVRERILALNELDISTYIDGMRRFRQLCEQVGI